MIEKRSDMMFPHHERRFSQQLTGKTTALVGGGGNRRSDSEKPSTVSNDTLVGLFLSALGSRQPRNILPILNRP
jgi:hypothetical protein